MTGLIQQKLSRRQILKGAAMLGLGSLAAACAAPVAPGAGPSAPIADAPPTEAVTIDFITPGALGTERDMYTAFVSEFMEANPNITVNVSFEAWNDYMTKLPTMLAGGVVPDMIHQHMSIVQDYAYRGALRDLVPYMERDGVEPEDYIPALFEAFTHNGKTYGIPKDSAAWGVYYNKDKFDEAGLDYPSLNWTLDEFHEMARELTRDGNGNPSTSTNFDAGNIVQWGFTWMDSPGPNNSENARGFVRAAGGDWYDEAYSQTLLMDPAVLDHFSRFHAMRCVERSSPMAAQTEGQGDPFRSGLTAMQVGFHTIDFFSREENVPFQYDVTFIPGGPGGQYSVVGCSGWAVPTQAGDPEAGWELVKFLTSLPVQKSIGERKRWGVSLKEAVDSIVREDGYPEHFRTVHTDPFQNPMEGIDVISFKFPPNQSRIKEVYATHFDPIWTCAGDDVEGAAASAKAEIDDLLAGLNWQ
ncbi:MAG: sugar ABC transporter substrate-binding protein [Caldilineaceae bacterium]|nr:sugar ABC transporter substrate-binding protein [Caldilineaceae bacterium]